MHSSVSVFSLLVLSRSIECYDQRLSRNCVQHNWWAQVKALKVRSASWLVLGNNLKATAALLTLAQWKSESVFNPMIIVHVQWSYYLLLILPSFWEETEHSFTNRFWIITTNQSTNANIYWERNIIMQQYSRFLFFKSSLTANLHEFICQEITAHCR